MSDNIQTVFDEILKLEAEASVNLRMYPFDPRDRAAGYAEGRRDAFRICARLIKSYFAIDERENENERQLP